MRLPPSTLVVTDETFRELTLDDDARPARPLGFYGGSDRVVTLGSLSKSVWAGLRIGWLRAAPELVRRIATSRTSLDSGTPVIDQLVADQLLRSFEPLLAERRAMLRQRRARMYGALAAHAPQWQPTRPTGGLVTWIDLGPDTSSTRLAAAARQHGVRVSPGTRFALNGTHDRYLRLPYTLPDDQLVVAVERLAVAAAATAPTGGVAACVTAHRWCGPRERPALEGTAMTTTIVVMGVAGSGKSTVAAELVARTGWAFAEGDAYHPAANVEKMRVGHPLTDEDRIPWLWTLAHWIGEREAAGENAVMTCSALRRSYRTALRDGHPSVWFAHLNAPAVVIGERMAQRVGHFMPPSLLTSQLAALEPLAPDEPGETFEPRAPPARSPSASSDGVQSLDSVARPRRTPRPGCAGSIPCRQLLRLREGVAASSAIPRPPERPRRCGE